MLGDDGQLVRADLIGRVAVGNDPIRSDQHRIDSLVLLRKTRPQRGIIPLVHAAWFKGPLPEKISMWMMRKWLTKEEKTWTPEMARENRFNFWRLRVTPGDAVDVGRAPMGKISLSETTHVEPVPS